MPEPGARRGWQDSEGNGDRFRFAPPPKVELEESPPPRGSPAPEAGPGSCPSAFRAAAALRDAAARFNL